MEYRDYYQILGVPRTASPAEIKKAFRKLARAHHPDVKPDDRAAERRFKDINEANAVLSDPAKRAQYDALGPDWESYARAGGAGARGGAGAAGGSAGAHRGVRYEFRTSGDAAEFSEFFRTFFEGGATAGAATGGSRGRSARGGTTFEEILGEMGFEGGAAAVGAATDGATTGSSARRPSVGGSSSRAPGAGGAHGAPDVEAAVEVTLEEAFHGTTRIVEVGGKRLEVTIPRGVTAGSRIRLAGRGGSGRDLYLVTTIRHHPVFSRHGADLSGELPISLREALLGAAVPVDTLAGRVLLTIPPETQNGRSFRLTGKGMPRLSGADRGDMYVKVRVVLPAHLSDEAREAARRFLDLVEQPDPRAGVD